MFGSEPFSKESHNYVGDHSILSQASSLTFENKSSLTILTSLILLDSSFSFLECLLFCQSNFAASSVILSLFYTVGDLRQIRLPAISESILGVSRVVGRKRGVMEFGIIILNTPGS